MDIRQSGARAAENTFSLTTFWVTGLVLIAFQRGCISLLQSRSYLLHSDEPSQR